MDILAHGLWAGAVYKATQKKTKKPLSLKWAVFWGVFPDLFAFTLPFAILIWNLLTGAMHFQQWPHPGTTEPGPKDALNIFRNTALLYSISHSLIIFLAVFVIIYLIRKKPVWELGGWLLHILIDVPTHSYQFYPTPILWPLSSWKFDGLSWATPWFMIVNYGAIILIYLYLWLRKKQKT